MLPTRRITKKARYPETKEGHPIGLLRIRKCSYQGYLLGEPILSE